MATTGRFPHVRWQAAVLALAFVIGRPADSIFRRFTSFLAEPAEALIASS
jgi:hypothetical protein